MDYILSLLYNMTRCMYGLGIEFVMWWLDTMIRHKFDDVHSYHLMRMEWSIYDKLLEEITIKWGIWFEMKEIDLWIKGVRPFIFVSSFKDCHTREYFWTTNVFLSLNMPFYCLWTTSNVMTSHRFYRTWVFSHTYES